MKQSKCTSWSTAFVIIVSAAYFVHDIFGEENALLCPDEENPFWTENGQVPQETGIDRDQMSEILELHWVPRNFVACDVNHNDDLKKNIKIEDFNDDEIYRSERRFNEVGDDTLEVVMEYALYSITLECPPFYEKWFKAVQRTVMHNLAVTTRVKLLKLFEGNSYKGFRRAIIGDNLITKLSVSDLSQRIEKGERILQNRVDKPNQEKYPDYESYETELLEVVRIYQKVKSIPSNVLTLCRLGCFESDGAISKEECSQRLAEELLHCVPDHQETLQTAIRFVRSYFGNDKHFDLKFPMVPPCFERPEDAWMNEKACVASPGDDQGVAGMGIRKRLPSPLT